MKGQLIELLFYPVLAVSLFTYFYNTLANEVYEIKTLRETIGECSLSLEGSNLLILNSSVPETSGKCPIRRIVAVPAENGPLTLKELIFPEKN